MDVKFFLFGVCKVDHSLTDLILRMILYVFTMVYTSPLENYLRERSCKITNNTSATNAQHKPVDENKHSVM